MSNTKISEADYKIFHRVREIIKDHIPMEGVGGGPGDAGCTCGDKLNEYSWEGYAHHLAWLIHRALNLEVKE